MTATRDRFDGSKYKATFVHCFDSLTTENDMKMNAVEPSPDIYDFTKLDQLINFATANGKRVRGHTLSTSRIRVG